MTDRTGMDPKVRFPPIADIRRVRFRAVPYAVAVLFVLVLSFIERCGGRSAFALSLFRDVQIRHGSLP